MDVAIVHTKQGRYTTRIVGRMEQPQKRAVLPAWKAEKLLIVEDKEPPKPAQKGNALIRIEASSVQSTDLLQRIGQYPPEFFKDTPPCTLGYDFVGKIVSISAEDTEATGLQVGDRVCEMCASGGHARYIERPVKQLIRVPDGIEPADATTLILSWMTAYQLLYRTPTKKIIESGGTIFIPGGAGTVARAAIMLAKLKGCTVYCTARQKDHEVLSSLGAIPFDYTSKTWVHDLLEAAGPNSIDAAFDGVASDMLKSTARVLKKRGKLVLYGVHALVKQSKGLTISQYLQLGWNALPFFLRPGSSFTFFDVRVSLDKDPEAFREDLSELFRLLKEGLIDARVGYIIDLEDIDKYHSILMERGLDRNIVCKPT